MSRPDLEVHKMLCVSTAHITEATDSLFEMNTDDLPIFYLKTCWGGETVGYFMPVLDPYPDGVPHTCPADLLGIIDFARARGFTWIMLDQDGPFVDGLPSWEW